MSDATEADESRRGVVCESWDRDMYPIHEEWASGEIGDRDYRILRSLQGPHILVEFEDMDDPVVYALADMVQHAHQKTAGGDDD